MSSTTVSVLLPLSGSEGAAQRVRQTVESYLETTGFSFEVVPLVGAAGEREGALLRRGVSDAKGSTIVVVDPDLPYGVAAIGDAVAMIQAGTAEVVFGMRSDSPRHRLLQWLLVDTLPDPAIALKAFSSSAAQLVVGETKLHGPECALEIAFLATKYGFRVEPLRVTVADSTSRSLAFTATSLGSVIAIRMAARRMGYRASRRCPVCFSNHVWTVAQIPANLVRACSRCKCRYLNQFAEEEGGLPVRRVLRAHPPQHEPQHEARSQSARDRTSAHRLALLRKQLPQHARVLEIGVRDASFGLAASNEFECAGIDHAPAQARSARAKGLDVYCATLASFVNTGPPFDAVAIFHVFENIPDPHDALGRIKDLLKPGGALILTTFDTEGLLYLLTERRRMAEIFRTRLILYSRSALIELLEHSGFEIDVIGPDFDYRDHRFLRHVFASRWPWLAPLVNAILTVLPDPLLVSTGSMRVVARRRAGTPLDVRMIRSAEATHAR